METLRIAVYHNLHSGGAKRVAAGHLRSLTARHHVSLYSLRTADHAFAAAADDPSVDRHLYDHQGPEMLRSPFGRLNPLLRMENARRLDALGRRMAEDIDRTGHDVALVHPCAVTAAPFLLKWLSTPSVYYAHEWPRMLYEPRIERPETDVSSRRAGARRALDQWDPIVAISRRYFTSVDRTNARAATRILTNSEYTRANLRAAYQREADVCYLGIEAHMTETAATAAPRGRAVLSVGSLTPAKGFDFVIAALATLPVDATGQRPPLVIISNFEEAGERAYLNALAARLGVNLTIHVGVSDADLRVWYARAGCVAYAPVREPFGLVALEAMAAGAPLVAVAEGGIQESVIDGTTGLLAPRHADAFGAAVARMLDDTAMARRLAEGGRANVAANWTWSRHLERLEVALQETAHTRAA